MPTVAQKYISSDMFGIPTYLNWSAIAVEGSKSPIFPRPIPHIDIATKMYIVVQMITQSLIASGTSFLPSIASSLTVDTKSNPCTVKKRRLEASTIP
jgi:hypothetical protein